MKLVVALSIVFVAAGLVLTFARMIKGPSLADRIAAIEHMSMLMIGVVSIWVIDSGESAYLDLAIVLALIGFLATIALARHLELGAGEADSWDGNAPGTDKDGSSDQIESTPLRRGSRWID